MRVSDFRTGARVTSPYASGDHFYLPTQGAALAEQVGTVEKVWPDGWARVTYPDGYHVLLNAERCNLYEAVTT